MPPERKYTWDAENRLTAVEPTVPVEDDVQMRFTYDYLGRRVQKQVFRWDKDTNDWNTTAEADLRFVYDGWNVILVLDGLNSNAVTRQYTWGLDLSGTLHGAGGVGGLLAAVETQGTGSPGDDQNYWFLYDGNGNVGQVLDATNPSTITTAAKYEYDPYGNLIASDGTYAAANPYHFSTKWFDDGLYYYGYRYYLPRLGRWISRDPIEEEGGLNLYGFVGNEPTDAIDLWGMFSPLVHPGITRTGCTAYRPRLLLIIENIAQYNQATDGAHFFHPKYHAQDLGFVSVIQANMRRIRDYDCDTHTVTMNKLFFEQIIGETTHTLQDIYAHTDWARIKGQKPFDIGSL